MSAQAFIKPNGCLFMLRKTSQRSWGKKWLEGVDAENMAFPQKPSAI
jgi:hypothetical protein